MKALGFHCFSSVGRRWWCSLLWKRFMFYNFFNIDVRW